MKLLTHTGRGILVVPGTARLAPGEAVEVSEAVAAALARVTPPLPIEISEISRGDESQPEARQGEGQPTEPEPQEEE